MYNDGVTSHHKKLSVLPRELGVSRASLVCQPTIFRWRVANAVFKPYDTRISSIQISPVKEFEVVFQGLLAPLTGPSWCSVTAQRVSRSGLTIGDGGAVDDCLWPLILTVRHRLILTVVAQEK